MTKKQRRQLSIGWSVALVLALTALAAGAGISSAIASDDPSSTTTSATTESSSATSDASPSATASDSAAAHPSPNSVAGASDSPSDSTSASASVSPTATPPTKTTEPTGTPTPTPPPLSAPDHYSPPDGTMFNHPFGSSASDIRRHVLRTVRSVPTGGSIRLAEFSLNDDRLVDSLIDARKRGVSVQVVVNNHNLTNSLAPALPKSPSFIRLRKVLGWHRYRPAMNSERVSFATICRHSCRGTGGDVHYKLFLFSSAGNKKYVTMMGSPNLTTKAAYGQWNHLDTYSNKATYDAYMTWFRQMKADTPQRHPYQKIRTGSVTTWTFPKPGTTARTDPWLQGLNGIRCTGANGGTGIHGRTKVRIGSYTFYDSRGRWMAKKVRSLWNAGCDVAIEYSIMGDTVKHILYSPSGRGRIPMRQVVTFKRNGDLNAYDHAKYITVSGHYGSDRSTWITWTGTTNISDLGFRSDDSQQVWRSKARYNSYSRDFYQLWRERQAHVPSPTSRVGQRFGTGNATLGKGRYANLEPN